MLPILIQSNLFFDTFCFCEGILAVCVFPYFSNFAGSHFLIKLAASVLIFFSFWLFVAITRSTYASLAQAQFKNILTLISCDPSVLVACGPSCHIWNFYPTTEETQSSDPFPRLSRSMGSHTKTWPKKNLTTPNQHWGQTRLSLGCYSNFNT